MRLLTTKQAAEKLNVSRSRIYQLIATGKLPAERFGRDFAIKDSSLASVRTFGKSGRPPKNKTG